MELPEIVHMARGGRPLNSLQASAGKLWLDYGGAEFDQGGAVHRAVEAHWNSCGGDDPYWDFLATRGTCTTCGETSKHENLAICPNCFATTCYRHGRACPCGHTALG